MWAGPGAYGEGFLAVVGAAHATGLGGGFPLVDGDDGSPVLVCFFFEEGRETRWAGYNSVIEWLDWFRPAQGGEEGRALRNFETGNDNGLGSRVFELLAS